MLTHVCARMHIHTKNKDKLPPKKKPNTHTKNPTNINTNKKLQPPRLLF